MTDLLAGLSPEQRVAAEALDGPVLIVAGPGSGKTRTITHRIAHGTSVGRYDAPRTLAVTFTARAAAELHSRLHRLGAGQVAVRTFHSAALRQLRHFWPEAVGGAMPRLEGNRTALLALASQRCGVGDNRDHLNALATELDWLKAACLTADDYAAHGVDRVIPDGLDADAVTRVLADYEIVKSERGVMDFDDVLLVTVGLLSTRSDLRESVRRAFRWITVDEFQDATMLQQRLLDLWVGDRQDLCVVGDPAQTIYQFAGADPSLLTDFPRRYPQATVVELPTTFRCDQAIAAAANALARDIPGALRLQSPQPGGMVRVRSHESDGAEARALADEIVSLLAAGHAAPEIACLYRIHHHGQMLAAELRRREVAYSTRGGDRFYERPEVREALIRYRGELRVHPQGLATEVMAMALAAMGHEDAPPEAPAARQRWESLAALAAVFDDHTSGRDGAELLQQWEADNEPPPPAGVSLLTLHAAKGLEWDTVFLVGVDDTTLPYVRATTAIARAEEQRLAYVGLTRARHRLVASWAVTGPTGSRRGPSPYLAALGATAAGDDPEPSVDRHRDQPPAAVDLTGSGRPPARCRVCGRALVTGRERTLGRCDTCPGDADDTLLTALLEWRDRRALENGIPGHVIATDVTVRAIAETRPTTSDELSRIPGMWSYRVADYGADLLALVAAHPVTADRGP